MGASSGSANCVTPPVWPEGGLGRILEEDPEVSTDEGRGFARISSAATSQGTFFLAKPSMSDPR